MKLPKIKRLDTFMLQTFLPLFAMTFLICLFIVMMQFLWMHVDEFVGKGLGLAVLGELFFYAALTMVPLALPLAILLASLMTFGNLGESLELLAIKSSGISLLRIMRPLTYFIVLLSIGAFFFQDEVMPRAQTKMYSLMLGIKHKSPELEIPEGVFYKEINDYNIYVGRKDLKTGMLYDVTIYIFEGSNIEDATVTVADKAKVEETPDGQHLKLTLWDGEQLGTFQESGGSSRYNQKHPKYRRESFTEKEVYIPYSNDLERTDESLISSRHVGKNLATLRESIDSLDHRIDSLNIAYGHQLQETYYRIIPISVRQDSIFFKISIPTTATKIESTQPSIRPDDTMLITQVETHSQPTAMPHHNRKKVSDRQNTDIPSATDNQTPEEADFTPAEPVAQRDYTQVRLDLDSLYASLRPDQMQRIAKRASERSLDVISTFDVRTQMQAIEYKNRSQHILELHRKFVLSIACLIFFFIGAPLGAIIRKGGMGVPVIVSVLFFIVYYLIDTTGNKMARDGELAAWAGAWLSSMVLAPIGLFLTWRAINDSTLFDWDTYVINTRRGLRWIADRMRPRRNSTAHAKIINS